MIDPVGDVAGRPHRPLDDDGLDLLELGLGGALPRGTVVPWLPGDVVTDAENTPLALIEADWSARALRPFARGAGPQWDPAVRLAPSEVRAMAARGTPVGRTVVAGSLPTRADVGMLAELAAAGPAPRLVLLVGRRPARPGAAAVVRAWSASLAEAGLSPVVIVVPCPAAGAPELATVLAAYGLADPLVLARVPPVGDLAADLAYRAALHTEFPDAAAVEIERARAGAVGRGIVVFFTGLSGSGKSTIAKALAEDLAATSDRRVTLLDGDEVRAHLSRGLGFDAESRAINIDRIGWVAALAAVHGGIAIAAPIAPFEAGRKAARAMAERDAAFMLVHVSTPLEVCEARDRKGMYARARAGAVAEFTGISSPYEPPEDADVTVDTTDLSLTDAVSIVRAELDRRLGA